MNELELIQTLTKNLSANKEMVTGPGDDCAVLDLGIPSEFVLFKTDAVVEGIHFTRESDPFLVGRKALARCLSDVAAMGGKPNSALVTIALPRDFDTKQVQKIYEGLNALALESGVSISGGETTTNPERILISIALLGKVAKDRCIHRRGSKVGDAIFVTGELGGSLSGKHLEFEPRLTEGQWLSENFQIHSMIDLSDGLASDMRHLLLPDKLGAELLVRAIPISRAAKALAKAESSRKTPLLAALTDGEDFELLFTVRSKDAVPLLDKWKERFPNLRLSCIGRITSQPGFRLRDEEGVREFTGHGFVHFQQPPGMKL
jgi:thiamine-monophosphate kinase